MSQKPTLEVLSADPTEKNVLIVDFSDGTTAYVPVEQLLKIRAHRLRTEHFPAAPRRVIGNRWIELPPLG